MKKRVFRISVFIFILTLLCSCEKYNTNKLVRKNNDVLYLGICSETINRMQERFDEIHKDYQTPEIKPVKLNETAFRQDILKMINAGENLDAFCLNKPLDNIDYYVENKLITDVTDFVQNDLMDLYLYCQQAVNISEIKVGDFVYAVPASIRPSIMNMPALMIKKDLYDQLNLTAGSIDIAEFIDSIVSNKLKIISDGASLAKVFMYNAGYRYITYDNLAYDPKINEFVYMEKTDEFFDIFMTLIDLVKNDVVQLADFPITDYSDSIYIYDYANLRRILLSGAINAQYQLCLLTDPNSILSYLYIYNGICIVNNSNSKETTKNVIEFVKKIQDEDCIKYNYYFGEEGLNYKLVGQKVSLTGVSDPIAGWNMDLFDYGHLKPLYIFEPEDIASFLNAWEANGNQKRKVADRVKGLTSQLSPESKGFEVYRKRMNLWHKEFNKYIVRDLNDVFSANKNYYDYIESFEYINTYLDLLNKS